MHGHWSALNLQALGITLGKDKRVEADGTEVRDLFMQTVKPPLEWRKVGTLHFTAVEREVPLKGWWQQLMYRVGLIKKKRAYYLQITQEVK